MEMSKNSTTVTIEQLIIGAKNNEIGLKVLIQAMLDSSFFIACGEEALTYKKNILPMCAKTDGESAVCVFTKKEWADIYMTTEVSVVKLTAVEWLKQHPANYGLIINPNHEACIKFTATGVQNIIKEFL